MRRIAFVSVLTLAAATARAETLTLTLRDAIDRALSESTASKIAALGVDEAKVAAEHARTALRPRVDAVVSDVNQSLNLQTFGLTFPGIPPVVPPFNVFDAHVAASMNVIDVAARRRVAAARQEIKVSEVEREQSDADVAAAVASLYLTIRRAESLVAETQANVDLFEKLRGQAAHEQQVGVGTKLDTTRADVQLSRQRQALLAAQTQLETARLALLRAIGADMGDALVLADRPEPPAAALPSPEEAIGVARRLRPDLRALDESLVAARLSVSAARGERWPKLAAQFQGGYNGNYLGDLSWTRLVGGSIALPVYSGGEIASRIEEAKLQQRSLEIRREDLDRRIQEDVRRSVLEFRNAASRVALAEDNARLAGDELTFATDRFVNGVSSGIEVDNAQTSVIAARNARVAALADEEQAWIDLKHATGEIRGAFETKP